MKFYPALEIQFTPEAESDAGLPDRLLAALDDFAPTAIEDSPREWRVFFQTVEARNRAVDWARRLDARISVTAADVADDDWAQRSQANVQPVRAGRIVVAPPWSLAQVRARPGNEPDDVLIVIVPSMGFGTGHHASTRMCLGLLQEIPLAGRSVLDVGTGSGVLAIAAARLGASRVVAIDNDPDAVASARDNIALNPTSQPIELALGDFRRTPPSPADIVVANITGELLRLAAGDVSRCTSAGGECIVSGVLATEERGVVKAFERAGLDRVKTVAEDEWVGMRFVKGGR
jgi:ribosomal protein L11 methyltransferase